MGPARVQRGDRVVNRLDTSYGHAFICTSSDDLPMLGVNFSRCQTVRSTNTTLAGPITTAGLERLSRRRDGHQSSVIEDIPSSMNSKETHHERIQPIQRNCQCLWLRLLPRRQLQLRLPTSGSASRNANRFTGSLRLRRAMQLRHRLRLQPGLSQRQRQNPSPAHTATRSWLGVSAPNYIARNRCPNARLTLSGLLSPRSVKL
jgi:hypothetical protein